MACESRYHIVKKRKKTFITRPAGRVKCTWKCIDVCDASKRYGAVLKEKQSQKGFLAWPHHETNNLSLMGETLSAINQLADLGAGADTGLYEAFVYLHGVG